MFGVIHSVEAIRIHNPDRNVAGMRSLRQTFELLKIEEKDVV